ncbi:tRNA lysidine(34) synthetase TilS [Dysgonomonas macrotermitis]|uniref:tRNA(Ile)-lysidine synthase n=1 Tax=Dysgonomonas macrotermitis TaxID=1346286 RepID=A0A1M5BFP9_9BACT|nr:tRNA lysidine(34) synthetase TilS [Dysgonomonas macrotermitis]SHF41002.1 tRNA(Ile)-lysidine synthase [Dysgonomonas macrotermitis]
MQTTSKVKKYIQDNNLLSNGAKVIIGVSGGADSIALLDILYNLGYECIVAHCNFHLRDQESYRDEYFVEKMCTQYNVQYVSASFNTKKYIKEESISLEMAARELRYAWFEKIRKKYKAEKIAVAHHQNDSVETVLINLIRGTGVRGLTGIAPINGNIIRPLLCIYREDILKYLDNKGLPFVEDSTNKEDIYTRNKIRLNVLPLLQTINPSVIQAIGRTSENLAQTEKIYLSYIEKAKKAVLSNNVINIDILQEQVEPKTILFEILFPLGFNAPTVDNIYESINGQSGKVFYSANYEVVKDRNTFIIGSLANKTNRIYTLFENETETVEPVKLSLESFRKQKNLEIERNPDTVYLDKGKLAFPLIIRKWKKGDKFVPFGMKGRKKVSDYFTDRKFSLIEKENIWLLCSVDDIVWIIGERADDRFKITDKTIEVLKIDLHR